MTHLREIQSAAGASFLPFGPLPGAAPPACGVAPSSDTAAASRAPGPASVPGPIAPIDLVESFGEYPAEYAAIRKGVGLFDAAHLGVVEVTGKDRLAFLHNMLTADIKPLAPGQGRRAFALSRKGRIDADLVVLHAADRTLLVCERFHAATLPARLQAYIFIEDVKVRDISGQHRLLSLHGPQAPALLAAAAGESEPAEAATATSRDREGATVPDVGPAQASPPAAAPYSHTSVTFGDHAILVYRHDLAGSPGLHLIVPDVVLDALHGRLAELLGGLNPPVDGGVKRAFAGRGVGWLALNTARIEAGSAVFHLDFGPDCLPHETGILREAVSFTKGCYLGQEIVARMENLGHPKKTLVGLRFGDGRMPVSGAEVVAIQASPPAESPGAAGGAAAGAVPPGPRAVVGAVTSSTLSPMAGAAAVAFAMVQWGSHVAGTRLFVPAEGGLVPATVQALRFLPPPA